MYISNFIIHLKELHIRTIYVFISILLSFIAAFLQKIELFFLISKFFLHLENGFIYTNLLDPLLTYIKLAFLFSIVCTIPVLVYIYSFFFAKAIYKFYVLYIWFYFISFYFGGVCLFLIWYLKLFPILINFFIQFQRLETFTPMKLELKATLSKYFIFFYSFIWLFLIIFIACNIFLFLFYFNQHILKKIYYRQFLYLLISILILLFAPPDITLHLIILPFVIIFVEITIYFVIFWYHMHDIYLKN